MSWMWPAMLLFWGLFIYAVYAAVSGRAESGLTAVETLDRRYARGELSSEDYRERRDALDHGTPEA